MRVTNKAMLRLQTCVRMARSFRKQLKQIIKTHASFKRNFFVLDDKRVVYVDNPKVACSSIKASILDFEQMDSYHDVHKAARKTDSAAFDISSAAYPGYFRFTFVRNPFSRLASCYENKYHTDKKLLGVDMTFMYYDYYLFGYIRRDEGFEKFVRRVVKIPPLFADKHFCPQWFVLQDPKTHKAQASFIGKFERLAEDYEPIRAKYDFKALPHYNKTSATVNWMDKYTPETAKLVYDYYKKDIELYGYQAEYEALLKYLNQKAALPQ